MLLEHNRNNNAASYQYSKGKKGAKIHIKVLNASLLMTVLWKTNQESAEGL